MRVRTSRLRAARRRRRRQNGDRLPVACLSQRRRRPQRTSRREMVRGGDWLSLSGQAGQSRISRSDSSTPTSQRARTRRGFGSAHPGRKLDCGPAPAALCRPTAGAQRHRRIVPPKAGTAPRTALRRRWLADPDGLPVRKASAHDGGVDESESDRLGLH